MPIPNLADAQAFMQSFAIDAWLVHDFRSSNPIFSALIPDGLGHLTRRVDLLIPARGEPTLITSHIDSTFFQHIPFPVIKYLTWNEYHAALRSALQGRPRIAMEYSPSGELPVMGIVDGGTLELVRSFGSEVVSSADLIQTTIARWSADAAATFEQSSREVAEVKDDAFAFIRDTLAAGKPLTEYMALERIHEGFRRRGLEWPDGPIVAANAHAGDPHFELTPSTSIPIVKGDWVLIDLWARRPGNDNPFCDICWVGSCGTPTERQVKAFNIVKAAQHAAVDLAQSRWKSGKPARGWEVDDAAMAVLRASGMQSAIRHRTGHSLSRGAKVHGLGVNIDNTETHDTRHLLPGVGFTIEPGLYFDDFGVRLEIDVYVDPSTGPRVMTPIQQDIIRLA
ncbi:MAG: aminopeptidase P family protein [Phycisphaeraceae bacterium]|nr:aminopeptidase P family protein [Phycisphaeraceae bacterium]